MARCSCQTTGGRICLRRWPLVHPWRCRWSCRRRPQWGCASPRSISCRSVSAGSRSRGQRRRGRQSPWRPHPRRRPRPWSSRRYDTAPGLMQRIRQMFRRGMLTFEMHVVPRAEVERVIRAHGGELLQAIDDNAAGDRWLSYTYVCRKG